MRLTDSDIYGDVPHVPEREPEPVAPLALFVGGLTAVVFALAWWALR